MLQEILTGLKMNKYIITYNSSINEKNVLRKHNFHKKRIYKMHENIFHPLGVRKQDEKISISLCLVLSASENMKLAFVSLE